MTQNKFPNNILYATDSSGGGGPSGGGGGNSAPAPSAPVSAPSAPSGSPGPAAARPASGRVATPAAPAAPSTGNPFTQLARSAGINPRHTGLAKPPANIADKSLTLDGDVAASMELPTPPVNKTKPPAQPAQPVDEFGETPEDGDNTDTPPADNQPDDNQQVEEQPVEEAADDQTPPAQPPPQQKKQYKINLEDLEPEDRQFAKRMHSSAVEHFAEKVKALRSEVAQREAQLEKIQQGGLPLSYYNHPEAFRLHPEFKTANENVMFAQKESQFWRKQLLAVENNQPFYVFEGIDGQGNDIIKGPFNPSPEAKISLQEAMYMASQAAQQNQVKLQQLQSAFRSDFERSRNDVKQAVEKNFGWLNTPDAEKTVVPVVGPDGKATQTTVGQLKQTVRNSIPQIYRDHPLAESVVPLFVAYSLMQVQLAKFKAEAEKNNTTQRTVALAEPPTNSDTTPTATRQPRTAMINGKRVVDRELKFDPTILS